MIYALSGVHRQGPKEASSRMRKWPKPGSWMTD